nr:olfactory receptor 8B3-like [Macaca mulatta]
MLTSMAYDCCVTICYPLLYHIAMSPKVYFSLMLGSYFLSFSGVMAHTGCMLRLTFCDANTINHYFCDILPVFQLSCTSTYISELVVFIVAGINIIVPVVTIFISYGDILSRILHISSNECSFHIIAVSLFFGLSAFMYVKPSSAGSMDEGKSSSVFYMNVRPMMSSLIYSLKSKDAKFAMGKALSRRMLLP